MRGHRAPDRAAERYPYAGLLLGFFLGLIGIVVILVMPNKAKREQINATQLHTAALEDDIYGDIVTPEARRAVQEWHNAHKGAAA